MVTTLISGEDMDLPKHFESFLEEKFDRLESDVQHERELRIESAKAIALELAKQAVEYERRLEKLNGENSRIMTILGASVPREVFENYKADNDKWKDSVTIYIAEQRGASTKQAAILAISLTLISLVIKYLPIGT